ncbi:aquaporin AQPAe.a-like [Diadema antillarum]|uniref:aquaporin AQPAe.a-like n=1 Tax=Diadema antillarum TaxID=105358 RepID=UPI003A8BFC69
MDDAQSTSTRTRCCKCSVNTCRCIVAEFFCSFLFMFIVGTTDLKWTDREATSELQIALTLGFAVATLTQCFDAVSGSHLNPVVSLGFLITRQVGIIRGVAYLVVQFSGAFTAVLLLQGIIPDALQESLGATEPSEQITSHQAFGIELILTFIFVFVVLSSWELRTHGGVYSWPCCRSLILGVAFSMNTMWGYAFTKASMNPARSLAAAVILNKEENPWLILLEVYLAGPVLGAVVSALIYKYIFATAMATADLAQNDRCSTMDSEEENMVALQSISSPLGRTKDTRDL